MALSGGLSDLSAEIQQRWIHRGGNVVDREALPQSQRKVGKHEGINSIFYCGVMGFTGNFHGTFAYVLHRSSKAEEENDERFHSTV